MKTLLFILFLSVVLFSCTKKNEDLLSNSSLPFDPTQKVVSYVVEVKNNGKIAKTNFVVTGAISKQ